MKETTERTNSKTSPTLSRRFEHISPTLSTAERRRGSSFQGLSWPSRIENTSEGFDLKMIAHSRIPDCCNPKARITDPKKSQPASQLSLLLMKMENRGKAIFTHKQAWHNKQESSWSWPQEKAGRLQEIGSLSWRMESLGEQHRVRDRFGWKLRFWLVRTMCKEARTERINMWRDKAKCQWEHADNVTKVSVTWP